TDPDLAPRSRSYTRFMTRSFIVAGARTPIGKFRGGRAPPRAGGLGGAGTRAALERARLEPDQVEYTVMGHVIQAGQGQITAPAGAAAPGAPPAASATNTRT